AKTDSHFSVGTRCGKRGLRPGFERPCSTRGVTTRVELGLQHPAHQTEEHQDRIQLWKLLHAARAHRSDAGGAKGAADVLCAEDDGIQLEGRRPASSIAEARSCGEAARRKDCRGATDGITAEASLIDRRCFSIR